MFTSVKKNSYWNKKNKPSIKLNKKNKFSVLFKTQAEQNKILGFPL